MATAIATAPVRDATDAAPAPYRFTVVQYHRMIDAGFFVDVRCELLEGLVVEKVTHNPPHSAAITALQRRLSRHLGDEWLLRIQCAITLADSEPEPDLAIVKDSEDFYAQHHPYPQDVALVVEVSDASLRQDRIRKMRLYAAARLPVYWIVNLVDRQVEVYTRPRAGRSPEYRQRQDYRSGATVPVVLAGREVARLRVRELLPSPPSA
jgi:Uma2 family endonuclease